MSEVPWDKIRADYERGAAVRDLARRHGVKWASTISKRAARESWCRPSAPAGAEPVQDISDDPEDSVGNEDRTSPVTAGRVVRELARMGLVNMRDLASWGPDGLILKASSELSEDAAAAVVEVAQSRDGVRIKIAKKAALDSLARHLGLFDGGKDGKDDAGAAADAADSITALMEALDGRTRGLPDGG